MEITGFRDYSDALVPLPALPPYRSDTDSGSQQAWSPSFRDELLNRIEDQSVQASGTPQSPVTRSIGLPESYYSQPALMTDGDTSADGDVSQELMAVCRDLEGFLLGILLKSMGSEFGGSDLFSQTYESSVYRQMFFTEIAQAIASQPPGFGIADMLYDDIIMKAGGSIDQVV